MSRFQAQVTSVAAIGSGVNFISLQASANQGAKLRRVTLGTIAGATTPTSQQLQIGVFRVTTAFTGSAYTPTQLDPNSSAAQCTVVIGTLATGVVAATPSWIIPFNTQSSVDLPWELLEEWAITKGTANGLALQNMVNAAPSGHSIVASLEWEE